MARHTIIRGIQVLIKIQFLKNVNFDKDHWLVQRANEHEKEDENNASFDSNTRFQHHIIKYLPASP